MASARRRRSAGAPPLVAVLAALVVAVLLGDAARAQTVPPTSPATTGAAAASSTTVAPATDDGTDDDAADATASAGGSTETDPPAVPDPPGTPLPAPLVAPAPVVDDAAPRPLRLEGFHVAPGLTADEPLVVVTFAELFDLPAEPWRVSVLVGDPEGERRRLSLVAEGGTTTGVAEVGDGTGWTDAGPLEVTFDPSGLVGIPMARALVPPGHGTAPPAIWVEVALGDEAAGSATTRTTGWYDLPSLLGEGPAGLLVGGRLAPLEPEPGDEGEPVVVDLGPGPIVRLDREPEPDGSIRQLIVVDYPGPAPSALGGLSVAEVVDRLEVTPDGVAGAVVAPQIEIDRTAGEVRLVDARTWPVVDATGDRSWALVDRWTGAPGEQGELVFDLDAVLAALGETPDRSTVALGLTRTIRLPDERLVVADGVLATTAWLDTAVAPEVLAEPEAPTVAATPPGDAGSADGVATAGLALVVGLALLGASLIVSGRRHRLAHEAQAAQATDATTVAPQVADGAGDDDVVERTDDDQVPDGDRVLDGEPAERPPPPDASDASAVDPTPAPDGSVASDASGVDSGAPEPGPDDTSVGADDPDRGPDAPVGEVDDDVGELSSPAAPWWRFGAAAGSPGATSAPPTQRRRHHAEGVTIDAALVTDLVADPSAPEAEPDGAPRGSGGEGAGPDAVPATPLAGGTDTPPGASEADGRSGARAPHEPAPDDDAGSPADARPGAPLDAEVDALEARLRRLGGPG